MSPLPNAEKYPLPTPAKLAKWEQDILDANTIPIQLVMKELYDVHVPAELQKSWKMHCPLGFEHPDAGIERDFRVYQTNTAYCFSTHGVLTPVRLAALRWDVSQVRASRRLMTKYGDRQQKEPYWKKMERLVAEAEANKATTNAQYAVAALHDFLSQDNRYRSRQFDPDVASLMESILEALDDAVAEKRKGAVREWFAYAKDRMRSHLDATPTD